MSPNKKFISKFYLGMIPILLTACSLGGPSNSDVVKLAKQEMTKVLNETPNMDASARQAMQASLDEVKIKKVGLCNHQKSIYHCGVDVTIKLPGAAAATTKTMMIHVSKGKNGWESVDY